MMRTRSSHVLRLLFVLLAGFLSSDGVLAKEPAKKAKTMKAVEPYCPEEMVLIQGGSFKLGGKKTVTLETFCLDRTEVTAEAYSQCVEDHQCPSGDDTLLEESSPTYLKHPDCPINNVTWKEARHYCDAMTKRLPTEEEWEWAARGRTAGNTYPWGNDPPVNQLCWSGPGNDSAEKWKWLPCPTNAHPKDVTPQGVLGMGGNVYEWTSSKGGKGERITRGGSWVSKAASSVAVSLSEALEETYRSSSGGFRCAMDPMP